MARRTRPSAPRRDAGRAEGGRPITGRDAGRKPTATARSAAPVPSDTQREIERLDRLADLLDSRYRVPGLGWRFGLDGLLGLIPGVGDVASLGPGAYIVYRAHRLGADKRTVGRMAVNAGLDFAVGTVPLLGDVFDVAFKANRRNIEILKRHLGEREAPARRR